MCGLVSLFAEHANVRFAAGFDFEALNLRTQTIVADSIKRFAKMVTIDELIRTDITFAIIGGEVFPTYP